MSETAPASQTSGVEEPKRHSRQALRRHRFGVRIPTGTALLALVSYLPLLVTKPGKVGADTKTYLYLDPGRLLSRAPYMWDPNIGLGTVTHQNIGYLWPMGPYYFVLDAVGMPDWIAQRLWMGSIIFAAGLGVRWMLRELEWKGAGVTVASFAYALSPYILEYAARISVILLPFAGLPWLIGLAARCLRRGDWKTPAIFALVTLTVGGVNATSLVLVMVGPIMWFAYATFVLREVSFADTLKAGLRISLLTLITSLWWLAGLMIQGRYGISILRYTETYKTVAEAALATELLRGLGYWFFYGQDGMGVWTASSLSYVANRIILVVSFMVPGLAFVSGLITRWRTRLFFALLIAAGLVIGVGAHPWESPSPYGALFKAWSRSDLGLSFRSTPRAAPLIILGLAVFLGAGVASLTRWGPSLHRPVAAVLLLLIVVNMTPLFKGELVDRNLMRDESVPSYWKEAADALSAGDMNTRALELPGIDFAAYRWGNTVDPITPGLTDRPFVARELIPYGTPPSANLLNALDAPFQSGRADPSTLAPLARLMGIGDILFRGDLQYERYLTPRPRETWWQLLNAKGLGQPQEFGPRIRNEASDLLPVDDPRNYTIPLFAEDPPQVSIFPVTEAQSILRTVNAASPVVLSGDGDGLVALASAGMADPDHVIAYTGSFGSDSDALNSFINNYGASLVITDTNRRSARRWGGVRDNAGHTERSGEKALKEDPADNRLDLFPEADESSMTTVIQLGGATISASRYGNDVTYTAGDRGANAMDGDPSTAWRVGAFAKVEGEFLDVRLKEPVTTNSIELLQVQGYKNRHMSKISLSFDGGPSTMVDLDESSLTGSGQRIRFPRRTFKHLRITVEGTDIGPQVSYKGISDVGIAELRIAGVDPISEIVVPPSDLLNAQGIDALGRDLTFLFTRRASHPADVLAADEEPSMVRRITNPSTRQFTVFGKGRLATTRSDEQVDQLLGLPLADDGGVTATSSARMPGSVATRARSAIDGDPDTAYLTPINDPTQELSFHYSKGFAVDDLTMTVMIGEKYSVPRRIRVDVDGERIGSFDVASTQTLSTSASGSLTRLSFKTGELRGNKITIDLEQNDERRSKDWFSAEPIIVPIAITDLNLPAVENPTPGSSYDTGCRDDLINIGGNPVTARMTGTFAEASSGGILRLSSCDGPSSIVSGQSDIMTSRGTATGLDVDSLGLASALGGSAGIDPLDTGSDSITSTGQVGPSLHQRSTGRLTYEVEVDSSSKPYWLVLGQSVSQGWHAVTSDGVDLGEPRLVNGYANGWLIDPARHGEQLSITLNWEPQRLVWIGLGLSAIGVVVCLALILAPTRRRAGTSGGLVPVAPGLWFATQAPAQSAEPAPARPDSALDGPDPASAPPRPPTVNSGGGLWGRVTFCVTSALVAGFFGGPVVAALALVASMMTLISEIGRWIIRLLSIALLAAAFGWVVVVQIGRSYPIDFKWMEHFEITNSWALGAIALMVISIAADGLLARWSTLADVEPRGGDKGASDPTD